MRSWDTVQNRTDLSSLGTVRPLGVNEGQLDNGSEVGVWLTQ